MSNRVQVQIIIAIAVVVWAVMLLVQGVTLKASYLQPYSFVVGVVILLLFLFERWLWRIPFVARLLRYPVLRGTWRGQLQSNWTDTSTSPIDSFLVVRQTYSTISLRFMTKESSSRSLVDSLETPRDDVARLVSTYQNIPGLLIQDRSRIHHGALMLEVQGIPASRLVGSYWTDRDTKGEVSFVSRCRKLYTSFDEASAATWPTTSTVA
jgi:hypothetical protein